MVFPVDLVLRYADDRNDAEFLDRGEVELGTTENGVQF
jgi:hypothetical protein